VGDETATLFIKVQLLEKELWEKEPRKNGYGD
jgi:hypothetical protein